MDGRTRRFAYRSPRVAGSNPARPPATIQAYAWILSTAAERGRSNRRLNSSIGPTVHRVHGVSRFHPSRQPCARRSTGVVFPLTYTHGYALPSGSMYTKPRPAAQRTPGAWYAEMEKSSHRDRNSRYADELTIGRPFRFSSMSPRQKERNWSFETEEETVPRTTSVSTHCGWKCIRKPIDSASRKSASACPRLGPVATEIAI